jgi:short-subunit dehydrogenase
MERGSEFIERYGPVALVTGASSGIGSSFAEALAARGLDLILVARRIGRLEALSEKLKADHGVGVTVCQLDLSAATAAEQVMRAAASLDVGLVVSNAGFGLKGPHERNDPAAMSDMLMVNCHTPMLLAHAFIPRLRQRGRGGIIFTGSIEGLMGCPYSTAYSATKAFINHLGEGLWAELRPHGIDVLTLCPGATDTEAPVKQGIDPGTLDALMSPDEVAALALDNIADGPVYVCSEHYRLMFENLLQLPRREALMAMADNLRRHI